MANFYSQFKALEFQCESKPIEGLTKQNWSDCLYLIRGKDEGIPAWHYILVPYENIKQLQNHKSGETIDCKKIGSIIQYRDNHRQIYSASGWGINPSYSFQLWIEKQYGDRPFDENTEFEYSKDDIRLCTIRRSKVGELIGIYRYYNKQGHFHYVKLFDNYEKTLAYQSGIRNYDRLISFNGINIENESFEQINQRFQNPSNHFIQLLVCNPSTFHFYKSNHYLIHQNLPTVQHISILNENRSLLNTSTNSYEKKISLKSWKTCFEDLPNEIFLEIFDYLKLDECDYCFNRLNQRLKDLLFYRENLSLIYDETISYSLMKSYRYNIKYLNISTSNSCDLSFFPNLEYFILSNRDSNHIKQIRSNILPKLKYLSFQFKFDYQTSNELIEQIFTNQFPLLRFISLRYISRSTIHSWLINPMLQIISIHSDQLILINEILKYCPNLKYFHIHLLYKCNLSMENMEMKCSNLKKFLLTSEGFDLTIDFLEILLQLIPSIEYLYFQTKCQIGLGKLIEFLGKNFLHLKRFDCFIKEVLMKNERIAQWTDQTSISKIFQSIQCVKENHNYRIFSTD